MLLIPLGRTLPFAMLSLAAAGVLYPAQKPEPKTSYAEVQRIFDAHCTRCHGAASPAADLNLTSLDALMKTSVAKAGKPDASVLMDRLLGKGGMPRMPMGFTALSKREIDTVRSWIAEGCLATVGESPKHWAYIAPVRPPVPKLNDAWVRSPIDAFVLARLRTEGLKPSPDADKTTLIRRLTLDLTGLPPAPEEVDAFLADRSPNAYEKVVDRLLSNPHYGEKMALPWLDAARYADSNGFQMEGDTYQYVWRDWVVRAMNANLPFDRFTTMQIAGDLLPEASAATPEGRDDLIATGFNRNHMLNGEGGAIPEEQRNVGLFDRVDTTSTTWLGLTMTCARCHDHKYDPLTQKDYFSLDRKSVV